MSEMSLFKDLVQKVVRQHYVPRHYLSAWGRPGRKKGKWLLWCKWMESGSFREVEVMSIGRGKRMYAYPRLNAKEQTLLIQFIKSKHKLFQPVLARMYFPALFMPLYLRFLEGECTLVFQGQVRELLCAGLSEDLLYAKMLEKMCHPCLMHGEEVESMKKDISVICDNGFEGLMTAMEEKFNSLLDRALKDDISFFDQKEDRQLFIYYLLIQMLRTTKFDKLVDECKWNKYPELQKMLRHGTAFEVAVMNAKEWNDYELKLLKNHSKLAFITGDQPLVNLDANDDSPHFDVYYPISPTKAFLFLEKGRFECVYSYLKDVSEREVHELNCKIAKVCMEQLFANSKSTFEVGKYSCAER